MNDAVEVKIANHEVYPSTDVVGARGGYTLIEMLLAVSLMTILIAAITITTGSFVQLSTKGRVQIQQAFAVDCIMDDLILDLKATMRAIQPTSFSEQTGPADIPFPQLSVGTERILQWDSSEENCYVSFVGNSAALLITRIGVNPRFAGQSEFRKSTASADSQQHLLWMSPSITQVTLAAEIRGPQSINRTFTRPKNSSGLLRAYVHRHQLTTSMETSDVIAMQFRYWDGKVWVENWNSFIQANQLPTAVEIRIRLKTDPENWRRFTCQLEQPHIRVVLKSSEEAAGSRP
jgi:prepilin-type N-terminal cleavage/methylation domain-containing protein